MALIFSAVVEHEARASDSAAITKNFKTFIVFTNWLSLQKYENFAIFAKELIIDDLILMLGIILTAILFSAQATPMYCSAVKTEGTAVWFDGLDSVKFIVVDKQRLSLNLYDEGGDVMKTYSIACAVNLGNKEKKGDHKTPEGRFAINQILNSSHLSHDFKDGKGPIAGAYGPWFLRLDVPNFIDIGIHGTHIPESIGSRSTEGCIRMRNEDIEDLKREAFIGMPVIILPDGHKTEIPAKYLDGEQPAYTGPAIQKPVSERQKETPQTGKFAIAAISGLLLLAGLVLFLRFIRK